jgi:hypothetical protein
MQCLRRPCETIHVRAAVLGVDECVADDAATAQRRTEAMGCRRSVRGQVATRAEGEGDGSERFPTASEARTKYSPSTPQGTRVGKGERTGSTCLRLPRPTAAAAPTPARPIAAAHIQPTHKHTHTRSLLRGGSAFHRVVALVCVRSTGAGSHGSAHAARPAPNRARSKGLNVT